MDWKKIVGTVAPAIAGVFGTPVMGVGVKIALEALGITPDAGNEEAQLEQAMKTATPDDLLKLKQADHAFKIKMKELNMKLEQTHSDDRKSARGIPNGIIPQVVLSVIYTVAYGVVLYCFMTGKLSVPGDQSILFGSLIGILTGAQVQILNFWFGSSSGSKEKTQAMANG